MSNILTNVWVPGHPRTKGSLTFKGQHAQDTEESARWRAMVAQEVKRDFLTRHGLGREPYPGEVSVVCYFLTAYDDVTTTNAGDVDKLARNVLDAIASDSRKAIMNGGVIGNDNQVADLHAIKLAASTMPHGAGLALRVTRWSEWDATQARAQARVMLAGIAVGELNGPSVDQPSW